MLFIAKHKTVNLLPWASRVSSAEYISPFLSSEGIVLFASDASFLIALLTLLSFVWLEFRSSLPKHI